ncbi:MAG: dihydrofolate reductase [Candidatus Aenigmarchaeota archaeon]|nr:dihydrofolate reductase [Candidatus Aenigmarchaeota archaeon]
MKVILYMAITANGMIAKENDDTRFISKTEWKSFDEMSKKIGNLIMGRRTYEISLAEGTFPYPDRLNIVMTNRSTANKWEKVIFTKKSPKDVLQLLERMGFKTAFVGGGGTVNASFMEENLIDEIYLDIEPVILGKGIKLFADKKFESKLKLIGIKKLSKNEIQLHYSVER